MRMKTLQLAVAGALIVAGAAAQAGGGGRVSSSNEQQLVCDQPLSRNIQSNSCVLHTPGAASQRVEVIPESSGRGFIVQPERPVATAPGSSAAVIAGSSPHTTVYYLEPVSSERSQVSERVALIERPAVVPAPDARNDAFPDPSPPSASSPSFHDPRLYDGPYDRDRSQGGPAQPQGPRAQPMME
jgi:hypothetical protein